MAHWYLIHGAASTRLTWTKQLAILPSVTRASLPSFDDVDPPHLIDAWADWALAQLRQPSVIMGHSMGGAIAQRMALKSPSSVIGLVLVGTGPHLPVNEALLHALRDEPAASLERITRWSLSRTPNEELLARSLEQVHQVDPHRAYREFLACTYFDARSRLHEIHCPIAVIAGADDRMTPSSLVGEFLEAWPDAPYYSIPHAGHMMMLEQPEAFNAALGDLCDRFNW